MTDTTVAAPQSAPARVARSLASSAAIIGLAFVISRALGLVRTTILAATFGTSDEINAFVAAFRIPDLIFLMVMSGAFGSAFVPVFAGFLGQGQERKAWQLASNVLTLMVEGFAVVAVVAFFLADPLVRLTVARGLEPRYQDLAIELTRILLLSPFFLGLGAAAKGMLESTDNFTLPAFAPIAYNIAFVLGALVVAPRYGVRGLAWSVVAASACHLLLQLPGLLRMGMRYSFLPRPVAEGVGTVGRLLGPRIIGQAAFQVNIVVITSLAGGAIAALDYAYQLMMLPHGLFAIAVSTVIFPAMSRQFANREFAALKTTLGDAIRPLLFLTLPSAVALMILARPIVQTVLGWGTFDAGSIDRVAGALPYFAAGLFALALVEATARAFYAMQDTRTPLFASLITIAVNLAAALLLLRLLGYRGLAAATSITSGIEMLILLGVLRRRIGPFDLAVWRSFLKSLLATAAMAGVLLLIRDPLTAVTDPTAPGGKSPWQILIFLYAVLTGLCTYLVAAWYLKSRELLEITDRFGGRLGPLGRRVGGLLRRR